MSRKVFLMKSILQQLDPHLCAKAQNLSVLTHILQEETPAHSHNHFKVVNISKHSLNIVTDSSMWATKLRQLAPQLVAALQNKRNSKAYKLDLSRIIPENIQHIQIVTRPEQAGHLPLSQSAKAKKSPLQLSAAVASQLASCAAFINDDTLKNALMKLSRQSRKTEE